MTWRVVGHRRSRFDLQRWNHTGPTHSKGGKSMRTRASRCNKIFARPLRAGPYAAVVRHQQPPTVDYSASSIRNEVMIPTRDGVKLHTEILRAKNGQGAGDHSGTHALRPVRRRKGYSRNWHASGDESRHLHCCASGHSRRYGSEGAFVMQRPVRVSNDPRPSMRAPTPTHHRLAVKTCPTTTAGSAARVSYGGWLT